MVRVLYQDETLKKTSQSDTSGASRGWWQPGDTHQAEEAQEEKPEENNEEAKSGDGEGQAEQAESEQQE